MTFLQASLLYLLPLAVLPVVIHLIHLYRRRQVKWAAMIFLLAAQKMNKGLSRLRQVLILAARVLAVAAIIFAITRPLAGGWLGLTGGAPDTVLILLDRSASMEETNPATGVSKRLAGLRNVAKAINDAVGTRSRLVLIDSARNQPLPIDRADTLLDVPQSERTDTAADIPGLLQSGLDYITTNKTGRTDVWLVSDLQQSDWDSASGRWEQVRGAFSTLQGVRFHLLCYPDSAPEDLGITVDRVVRRESAEKAELLLDLRIVRRSNQPQPVELPLRVVVNGSSSMMKAELKENQLVLQAQSIAIDKGMKRGWGSVELPADAVASNNIFYFVFDEPTALHSVIISDDAAQAGPLKAALSAAADPARKYDATVLGARRAAEIPWDETAFVVWQVSLPAPDDPLAGQLKQYATNGRSILFLPPDNPGDSELFGLRWGAWKDSGSEKPGSVAWWRNDADLLANTQDGSALPVGTIELTRRCAIIGEGVPLARAEGNEPLLERVAFGQEGKVYFLGTLPGSATSSLARDGVVMFALLHRALNEGARTLGKARQRLASAGALGVDIGKWRAGADRKEPLAAESLPLRAGIVISDDQVSALNRPPGEDTPARLSTVGLNELFAGLDFRVLTDSIEEGRNLTNEIWRTFLIAMAAAILIEALLCLPPRREAPASDARAPAKDSPRKEEAAAV